MFRIFFIAKNTLSEATRQPIYLIVLFCSILLVLTSPYYTLFALLENNKLIKDMGVSTLFVVSVLVSAFTASSVIFKEIENNTLITVISKPISRPEFLIGKFLGIFIGVCLVEYLLGSMLLQVVRTRITEAAYSQTDYPVILSYFFAILFSFIFAAYSNFFYEKPFISSVVYTFVASFTLVFVGLCFIDNSWQIQNFAENLDGQLIIAILLVMMATSLICAIATAASTRLSTGFTFAICIAFFLVGLFSDYIFGQYAETSTISSIFYYAIPNLQMYWVVDAILDEKLIPTNYLHKMSMYTMLYLLAILSLGITLFQKRETN